MICECITEHEQQYGGGRVLAEAVMLVARHEVLVHRARRRARLRRRRRARRCGLCFGRLLSKYLHRSQYYFS